MRNIVFSVIVAASLLTLTSTGALAQDQVQQVPNQDVVREETQRPATNGLTVKLKPGTFILRGEGKPPWMCIAPKMPKVSEAAQQRARDVRKLRETLNGVMGKVSREVRVKLKNALDILAKLKDPCGEPMKVMMGTSARCQGGSGN